MALHHQTELRVADRDREDPAMSFAVWFKTRESQPECCQPNCPKEIAVEYVKLSEVSVELKRRKLWNSVN